MLKDKKLYRYVTNKEGVFSAGKRLLPENLADEALHNRQWLPKPKLPEGEYRFYLTKAGKEKYEATLLRTHRKYLANIQLEEINAEEIVGIVYQDEWQVVVKKFTEADRQKIDY